MLPIKIVSLYSVKAQKYFNVAAEDIYQVYFDRSVTETTFPT